jgi:hypothetical protein
VRNDTDLVPDNSNNGSVNEDPCDGKRVFKYETLSGEVKVEGFVVDRIQGLPHVLTSYGCYEVDADFLRSNNILYLANSCDESSDESSNGDVVQHSFKQDVGSGTDQAIVIHHDISEGDAVEYISEGDAVEKVASKSKAKARAKAMETSGGSSNDNYPIMVKFWNDATSYELIIDKTWTVNHLKSVVLNMPQYRGLKDTKKISFKVADDYLRNNRLRCVSTVPQNCRLDVVSGGAGGGKAIKKEKLSKQEKLKSNVNEIKGQAQTLLKLAEKSELAKKVRAKVNSTLSAVGSDATYIKKQIENAEIAQKISLTKALQAGNIEHRFETFAKLIFPDEFDAVSKARVEIIECTSTMKSIITYALLKEFGDDAGNIKWKSISDILNPADDDVDGLKDF